MKTRKLARIHQSATQMMIKEFWVSYPQDAPKSFHHVVMWDGVHLRRCDNDVYIFSTENGEYWSYEQAKGLLPETSPTVAEFFSAVNGIKLYVSQFGMGDWATSIKFYTPHDWRAKGNAYPSLNSRAIAVLVYDGGAWFSAMGAEFGTEIQDGFLAWIEEQGFEYEILNPFSMAIYKPSSDAAYQSPADIALGNFQYASDTFSRHPSAGNYDALKDAAIAMMRVTETSSKQG